jgi:hypothetical protein
MSSEDIEKIRKILKYKGRHDLAELLRHSTSRINKSSTYGSHLFSTLSTFEIYSPLEFHEKLKELSKEDKKEILNAVLKIYPPKECSPEIVDLTFYVDVNSKPEEAGLLAYCNECGASQGLFIDIGELRRKIAEQKKCVRCGTEFSFLLGGRIRNLNWEIIPSKEEYIMELLGEIEKERRQVIFCYEDLGPSSSTYRYPQKRITFNWYRRTERASPAYVLNIYDKDTSRIEKSYCFDSPYALFQIAREALKGYKWLRYGKGE